MINMKNLKYSPNADDILENTVPIEYLVKYSRAFELPRERRMNRKEEKSLVKILRTRS